MEITFVGAAREVTGSCHLLHVNGYTVALDCGMFQGKRQQSAEKNRQLPLPIADLDAVVLSHAHIDHSGRLPYLIAEGYARAIWATSAPVVGVGRVALQRQAAPATPALRAEQVQAIRQYIKRTWTMLTRASASEAILIDGLTPGTIYAFQVRAHGVLGYTDWSDSATRMCI